MTRLWRRIIAHFRILEWLRFVSLSAMQREKVILLRSDYPNGRLKTRAGRTFFVCKARKDYFEFDLTSNVTRYYRK